MKKIIKGIARQPGVFLVLLLVGGIQMAQAELYDWQHWVDTDRDIDGDCVADHQDACPNTPFNVSIDERGCEWDSDRDGVPDSLDHCPGTPLGTTVNKHGCPPQEDDLPEVTILRGVNFHFDSARLTLRAKRILDKVARNLAKHPGERFEIGGHTDHVGSARYNDKLSLRRAISVRIYLVRQGGRPVNSFTVRGYGFRKPVASNRTEHGRSHNRRVELRVLR